MKEMTLTMPPPEQARRGSGGRPTREEAVRRDARLLEVAATMFMERGFEGTSIDAVAEKAGVGKPTIYARYRDKAELFTAVMRERIETWLAPMAAAAAPSHEHDPDDISSTLHMISRHLLDHSLKPQSALVQRMLAAQATQFPELAKLAHKEAWARAVQAISLLFKRSIERGCIHVDEPEIAAGLFLDLIVGSTKRNVLYGIPLNAEFEEKRRKVAVDMFVTALKTGVTQADKVRR
ncbi:MULTISPECIES: TetR/AcrR family transcriptional regulator [unclassified Beijerinckia]|uniref:TetR/AcrR family transcriptional regulator n=1 Tax=unclassified Beijerinckia TaxID=2638183 RepID=UPI000899B00C|nr:MULTISPECIES: TetR/AcrR family transcriptional regulator [unclassified Beijerinckia]MDH7794034.1 TetR/AcrR family transcriptional repressor of mexJK operon [Beijerinckia sp. GAS462]SEB51870.1 transcriptional regulator, TetR family [Beijerinckia sp. 28-YEA-48]